ncbi:MBL fold metallo-hydrolase [candidate division WOR-3 bacterium]|nr:MBL fold metallo-hydrolase [candidate division WOR-3 bacterium]
MKIKPLGAVRTVTGSMHLLESSRNVKCILDCGLYQGKRADSNSLNRNLKTDPSSVESVVISHAHIDHCGLLPYFVKKGFRGHIFMTPATRELTELLLLDSAHLQFKDAEYINRKKKAEDPEIVPLYTGEDVEAVFELVKVKNFGEPFEAASGLTARFLRAGHILGSAMVEVSEKDKTLLFSGDLGRMNAPLLKDPEHVKDTKIDCLLIESTYGGKKHHGFEEAKDRMVFAVEKISRTSGKLIIPAFSVGRTQDIVYTLHELMLERRIPSTIEIFVDSPLSTNVTEIYRQHFYELDEKSMEMMAKDGDPFGFGKLKYTKSVEQSKELNEKEGPIIIISASGMCEGGRIVHHLKNNIEDEKNVILIVSFQAVNTLGRRIADGMKEIKIFGKDYEVRAEVLTNNEWSAHADGTELFNFIKEVNPGKTLLVHGEINQMEALKAKIDETGIPAGIPDNGEGFVEV